jgi:hypothetical protein
MKSLKTYMAWLAAAIAVATGVSACQDDFDDPGVTSPVATLKANTTLLELKKAYWNDATNYIDTIGVREDGSHYIIHGTVVSSDEASNVFKSLVIQDGTAAMAISINSYNLYLKYRRGQEVVIDATGMYIGKYNGLQQLGFPEWYENGNAWEASFMSPEFFSQHVELNGLPDIAAIDTLEINSFSELPSDPDGLMEYQSRLVKFNNVAFVNGGKEQFSTYHSSGVNQSITDSDGSSLPVRTSGYSNFWNNTLPEGRGDVVCILSYYGTTGWQLILNDYAGCMNFGNPTVAPGAESNPYTVAQAIEVENSGASKSGWITGYIVGAVGPEVTTVTSNDDIEWTSTPLLANTLVIGSTPNTKDINSALVVELTYGTALYQYGNLVNNPANYGKQIWIRGNLAKAMGTYGVTGNSGLADTWKIEGVEIASSSIKDGAGTQDSPYSVSQVLSGAATGTAWVSGYIVGSSNGMNASDFHAGVEDPSQTNVFIANSPDVTDYTKCVPVQLPSGTIRSAVNLKDNPGNVGKILSINGSIEKYFGQTGVKSATDYSLEGEGSSTVTPDTPSTITGDGTETNPYDVAAVISINPTSTTETTYSGVWVKGYIVGWADLSSTYVINETTATFNSSATLKTNILVGPSAGCTDYTKCIGVQLPYGDVRTALNLQDNPDNFGKEVYLKGDILKYSGVPGLKNTSDYKLGEGGGSTTPDTPDTPDTPSTSDEYLGDFNSFNNSTAAASPYGTYTNATGWTAENSIILGGTDGTDANPYFTFIGGSGVLAPTLNGKTTTLGKLTSPTLTGGIATLTFNYGFAFTESKCQFTVNVKDTNGNVVKTDTVTLDSITKLSAYSYSLDVNYSGDFIIEITNNGYSGSTSNKDRLSIFNLTWTK